MLAVNSVATGKISSRPQVDPDEAQEGLIEATEALHEMAQAEMTLESLSEFAAILDQVATGLARCRVALAAS